MKRRASLVASAIAVLCGCLPADNRPEPASLRVHASPSDATLAGFSSQDGWEVRFERFVCALGDVRLESPRGQEVDVCNAYSETRYEWLYDFVAAEREKVALTYGLGTCDVTWRFRGPSSDTVLGAGATDEDKTAMRVEATDAYEEDARATLVVRGAATREGTTKRFAWTFRRGYELGRCAGPSGDAFVTVLELRGGSSVDLDLEVRGEELFRRGPDDEEPLVFDAYASADANQDGDLTLEELAAVDAPTDVQSDGSGGTGGGSQGSEPIVTLADLMYVELLPRVTRVRGGGACEAEVRGRR